MTILNVMFSPSPAATLRRAIAEQGRPDQVVALYDSFSFGPIDGDVDARHRWIDEELGIDDWNEVTADNAPFLEKACAADVTPVAWISRRDATCYANFLWWLSHRGSAPCRVVDVTDMMVTDANGREWNVLGPSMLGHDNMLEIIDTHVPLSDDERARYRALWRQLVAENASLRVVDQSLSLVSAPITFFDERLLAHATIEWKKMARMIGYTLASFADDGLSQTGDLVLAARALALAEAGALEWRGDLSNMQKCEVRLPER